MYTEETVVDVIFEDTELYHDDIPYYLQTTLEASLLG